MNMKKTLITLALLAATTSASAVSMNDCSIYDQTNMKQIQRAQMFIEYKMEGNNHTLTAAKASVYGERWHLENPKVLPNLGLTDNLTAPISSYNKIKIVGGKWQNKMNVTSYQLNLKGEISYLAGTISNNALAKHVTDGNYFTYICGELQTTENVLNNELVSELHDAKLEIKALHRSIYHYQVRIRAIERERGMMIRSIREMMNSNAETQKMMESEIKRLTAENENLVAELKEATQKISDYAEMMNAQLNTLDAQAENDADRIFVLEQAVDWFQRENQILKNQISAMEFQNMDTQVSTIDAEVTAIFEDSSASETPANHGAGSMGFGIFLIGFMSIIRKIKK